MVHYQNRRTNMTTGILLLTCISYIFLEFNPVRNNLIQIKCIGVIIFQKLRPKGKSFPQQEWRFIQRMGKNKSSIKLKINFLTKVLNVADHLLGHWRLFALHGGSRFSHRGINSWCNICMSKRKNRDPWGCRMCPLHLPAPWIYRTTFGMPVNFHSTLNFHVIVFAHVSIQWLVLVHHMRLINFHRSWNRRRAQHRNVPVVYSHRISAPVPHQRSTLTCLHYPTLKAKTFQY